MNRERSDVKGETTGAETAQPASAPSSSSGHLTSHVSRLTSGVSRPFLLAWHFLTAVPLSRLAHDPRPEELARSMLWYPAVGLILGWALAVSDLLLTRVLSPVVVNGLLLLLLVAVTRGLHQDGLADFLDGLAGGRTPAERLAVMRDGRIGAIGATGLILDLGLRYAGLTVLSETHRFDLLICLPAVGRWSMVLGAYGVRYARAEGGLAGPFLGHLTVRHLLAATGLLGAVLLWLLGPTGAVLSLLLAGGVARAMSLWSRRLLGGTTGDVLGATNEIVETLWLLAVPVLLGLP
ncbi:MAG: adenosylcobinamide-GDP ribazoletransferase [Nitrospirota bacterium]